MASFIANRLQWMLLVLFVVSGITFILMHQIPGGPFDGEKALPEHIIRNLEEKYNLDDSLPKQYVDYVSGALIPRITTGEFKRSPSNDYLFSLGLPFGDNTTLRWMNFGPSFTSRSRNVNDIFRDNMPVSAQLGIYSLLIALIIGIPAGVISAFNRNTIYDYTGMGVAILGVSIPVVTMAPLLRYIFGVELGILPPTGWGDFKFFLIPANSETLKTMIMPSFALGFSSAALLARLTRASLLQVLEEDYIRTARAKGLGDFDVVVIHTMKNAMIPVVTIIGPLFAALITGTFVTEIVFAIPGMGRFFISSITNRDYPVIMGTILIYAFFLVVANFIVDIVYAWLDPRIRYNN